MDEWNIAANNIERKTIADLQEKLNKSITEKLNLENKVYQLEKQVLSNRPTTVINVSELPRYLGNTTEERLAKVIEMLETRNILLIESDQQLLPLSNYKSIYDGTVVNVSN